ncbi:MAG: prepilin-type N-terminal cleavage/methylation domain-containing protein [Lachnospiraceae bacterium]|nr:prepilin-type N-terminal cleavage/methylation domain-containing protein [Lachnospiraceae bacterium]
MRKLPLPQSKNNKAFTLLEVLIAIIILAIVSIPILHAFMTSATTTGKSKLKMYATDAAENIMEDIKANNKNSILNKYCQDPSELEPDENGMYEINITSTSPDFDDDLNDAIDSGFTAKITLDPGYYPNTNSLNPASFDSVSSNCDAIYVMSPTLDDKVYGEYLAKHETYLAKPSSSTIVAQPKSFFEENLKREIKVEVKSTGNLAELDSEGNPIVHATVDVTVAYLLAGDSGNTIELADSMYKAQSSRIFDNKVTKKQLNSVFIMYEPRYLAAPHEGDIITVHNPDGLEFKLYIIAQNTESHGDSYANYMAAKRGLILELYGKNMTKEECPVSIYTNLIDESKVDYYKDSTKEITAVPIKCFLTAYEKEQDPEGIITEFDDSTYNKLKSKALLSSSFEASVKSQFKYMKKYALDGRTLDANEITDRFYNVTVEIEQTQTEEEAAIEWPIKVSMSGTMLDEEKK